MVNGQWPIKKKSLSPVVLAKELLNDQTTNFLNDQTTKRLKNEEFKMEDGDSDTDKYPHRTGNIAGHYQLHGTWAVLLLKQPLPCPSPKREGLFC